MPVGLSLNKCVIVRACRSWSESPIKSFNQYKREREMWGYIMEIREYVGQNFVTKQISRKRIQNQTVRQVLK